MQVFVTGVYSSGKTHFARRYAAENSLEYMSFDSLFDYADPNNQSRAILENLPHTFVMDAIPIDESYTWKDFIEYERSHPVTVICVYCPDRRLWLQRIQEKKLQRLLGHRTGILRVLKAQSLLGRKLWHQVSSMPGGSARRIWRLARRWRSSVKDAEDIISGIDERKHLKAYRRFFSDNLPALSRFQSVKYFDSQQDVFTSKEEMLNGIGYRYFALEDHLVGAHEDYDIGYQDIELIDFIGYTASYKTWDNIHSLVDWRKKRVVDLGCFHGYFAFKVEDSGGIAHGLDKSAAALTTARMINDLRGGKVVFTEWEGGGRIPDCDVILCLNVLHHFDDPEAALSMMGARQAVFEINRDQMDAIRKHFKIVKEVDSHRRNRTILLCERSNASQSAT
ncbi:MAG TPA: methyltransferase domain-containing protein [Anaerolineae bacterium]|nr:methyltransferase domain-containing protein [Anaerolineae bacterium]